MNAKQPVTDVERQVIQSIMEKLSQNEGWIDVLSGRDDDPFDPGAHEFYLLDMTIAETFSEHGFVKVSVELEFSISEYSGCKDWPKVRPAIAKADLDIDITNREVAFGKVTFMDDRSSGGAGDYY